jgi:hypothetical protein
MKNLNVNTDFLLDIWADLKAKKLAPVAIGLVVAVVAMPALMLTGDDAPTAGPLPIIAPAATDTAEVQLAEELAEGDSKLDSYKARDPFDGLVKPDQEAASGGSGTAIAPSDLIGKGDGAGGVKLPSLGSGGGGSSSPDLGGSTPGSGGLDTTGGGEPPVTVRRTSKFTYQLDVKFGRPGREQRYPNLTRMSFLPSADVPALLFMGVPADEQSALFFVHPTLSHAGEGECIPNKRNCNFLKLAIGREHFLSVDDYEFRIELLGIKRVKLSTERKQRASARKQARSPRSARGEDALGGDAAVGQYSWPLLADGIG